MKIRKFFIRLLFIIAVLAVSLYLCVGYFYKQVNYKNIFSVSGETLKEDGVTNILLIGNDSRSEGEDGRSDAMILLSVSDKTKKIHMTSFLRDIYVDIPGYDGNRLNAAYSFGGAELLLETIERNFDIKINRFVQVNFQTFANLVDALGGVTIDVTNEEVQYINAYLDEYNLLEGNEQGTYYLDKNLQGNIHLNGPQALAFCRNRYIGTDFGRTERQRKVLSAMVDRAPRAVLHINELSEGVFGNITTNLTQIECASLLGQAVKFGRYEIVQNSIPLTGTYTNTSIRGMDVLDVDFEANNAYIQTEIYGENIIK